jgi:hypothetical protein
LASAAIRLDPRRGISAKVSADAKGGHHEDRKIDGASGGDKKAGAIFLEVEHYWSGCVVVYCGWETRSASDSVWAAPGTLDND